MPLSMGLETAAAVCTKPIVRNTASWTTPADADLVFDLADVLAVFKKEQVTQWVVDALMQELASHTSGYG